MAISYISGWVGGNNVSRTSEISRIANSIYKHKKGRKECISYCYMA